MGRLLPLVALTACTAGEIAPFDEPVLDLADDEPIIAGEVAEDRVIVRFDGEDPPEVLVGSGARFEALRIVAGMGVGVYAVPDGLDVAEAVDVLQSAGYAAEADPIVSIAGASASADPGFAHQWHMARLGAEESWAHADGSGVVVAVIDSGVSGGGPDGLGELLPGWDFVADDADPSDENGHGTHVAGTIAQRTGNGVGVAGLAPGAAILPLRVLNASGTGYTSDIIAAIDEATTQGADVINLSLGGRGRSTSLSGAITRAREAGVVVVAASGNNGNVATVLYPAAYPGVIGVGATRYDDERARYSNGGRQLDLVAPGGDTTVDQDGDGNVDGVLQETVRGGKWGYFLFQGTSMATPHVAASAALLLSAGATPEEAEALLTSTALDLGDAGRDDLYGNGLVQPLVALEELAGPAGDVDAPVVSRIRFTRVADGVFDIGWTTDEDTTGRICTPTGSRCTGSRASWATEHVARASRGGAFVVLAEDQAGNETVAGPFTVPD